MTPAEFYTLNLTLIDQYNSIFEYRLSIAFAFVVAFFFISKEDAIGSRLKYFLASLYAVIVIVLNVRFGLRNQSVGNLHDAMLANNVPFPP